MTGLSFSLLRVLFYYIYLYKHMINLRVVSALPLIMYKIDRKIWNEFIVGRVKFIPYFTGC